MKKLLLILVMVLGLAACKGANEGQSEETSEVKQEERGDKDSGPGEEKEVYISAAASLQDALNKIVENYKKDNNVDFKLNYGGSGALQAQIEEGAEADIFFSAAQKQMTALIEGGFVDEGEKEDLLLNDVVLIVPKGNEKGIESIEDLGTDKAGLVALGDPASVPVGQYSQEILDYYGLADDVSAKTTYGSDVRQVLSWVVSGEVDAGFVYRTDAMTDKENIEIVEPAPKDSHKPVVYPIAPLKDCQNKEAALSFINYLKTDEAMGVFEKYGFGKKD